MSMSLSAIDKTTYRFTIKDDYRVQFKPGDYYAFVVGQAHDAKLASFTHPTVAAKCPVVHEFKHSNAKGRKWWTAKAGYDFVFVVPRDKVWLVAEAGYSYVPVLVNGVQFRLNVSGGGGGKDGWTDMAGDGAHVGIAIPKSAMEALAAVALTRLEVAAKCPDLVAAHVRPCDVAEWSAAAAKSGKAAKLVAGQKVILADGCKWKGSQGPFTVAKTTGRGSVLCRDDDGVLFKASPRHIDAAKTIVANGVALPTPKGVFGIDKLDAA